MPRGWPGALLLPRRGIDPLRPHTSDHIPRCKVERSGDSHKVGQSRRVSERGKERADELHRREESRLG